MIISKYIDDLDVDDAKYTKYDLADHSDLLLYHAGMPLYPCRITSSLWLERL